MMFPGDVRVMYRLHAAGMQRLSPPHASALSFRLSGQRCRGLPFDTEHGSPYHSMVRPASCAYVRGKTSRFEEVA